MSRYAAICLPPPVTSDRLRTAPDRAVAGAVRTPGLVEAHRIEVDFDAVQLAIIPTVERIADRAAAVDAPSMRAAMQAFKVITVVAKAAQEHTFD